MTLTDSSNSRRLIIAATLFIVLGALNIFTGLAMLVNSEVEVLAPRGALISDIATWGWITLTLGLIEALTGWGLLKQRDAAFVAGTPIGVIAVINARFVIQIYAVSGILAIALSIMAIYALITSESTD